MGAHKRVDFSERDKQLLYLLYKHRYCDFTALNGLFVESNLYKKLKKLSEFGYIRKFDLSRLTRPLYSLTMLGRNWLMRNMDKEFDKSIIKEIKMSSIYNLNHHLKIAEIGALLTIRNIDYEIDLTCKKAYPELKFIPDIVIEKEDGLIALEIELENKSVKKNRIKLSKIQMAKEIKKVIFLSPRKDGLENNFNRAAEIILHDNGLGENIIINSTMDKLRFVDIKDFCDKIALKNHDEIKTFLQEL